jgi:hypothetical protein
MQLLALLKNEQVDEGRRVVSIEEERLDHTCGDETCGDETNDGDSSDDDSCANDKSGEDKSAARGSRRGRRAAPEELPRVEIEVTPPEVLEAGLAAFRRIGEDVSEAVERRPASLVVRVIRPKYARKASTLARNGPPLLVKTEPGVKSALVVGGQTVVAGRSSPV